MKNIKSRILLVLLSNLILFNSFGFGLVEHSCTMRGKKTYSFIAKDTCKGCDVHKKTSSKTTISRSKCCNSEQQKKQENISESLVNIATKFIKAATNALIQGFVWLALIASEAILNVFGANQPESSSLFGKNLLIFISLFRL